MQYFAPFSFSQNIAAKPILVMRKSVHSEMQFYERGGGPVGPSVIEVLWVRPRVFWLVQPGHLSVVVNLQRVIHHLDNVGKFKSHVVLLAWVLSNIEQAD